MASKLIPLMVLFLVLVVQVVNSRPVDHDPELHQCPASGSFVEQTYTYLFVVEQESPGLGSASGGGELCTFCSIALPIARRLVAHNETRLFVKIATLVCVELKITDANVCSMAIGVFQVSRLF